MRKSRALRVRKTLKGSPNRPRLSVSKTNKHLFAQLIDDESGKCLMGIGTRSKELKETKYNKKSKESAAHIGVLIARAAKEKNIERVVFDRGRFKYHGIVAALADAARSEGLKY